MISKSFITALVVIGVCLPTILTADDIVPLSYPPKVSVMLLANSLSAKMGVSVSQIKSVLKAESGDNQEAVGDYGLAHGVAQYHIDTFNQYENLYFTLTGQHLDYNSAQDQITLMVWQWKVYPQSKLAWSTYRRLYLKRPIKK